MVFTSYIIMATKRENVAAAPDAGPIRVSSVDSASTPSSGRVPLSLSLRYTCADLAISDSVCKWIFLDCFRRRAFCLAHWWIFSESHTSTSRPPIKKFSVALNAELRALVIWEGDHIHEHSYNAYLDLSNI